MIESCREEFKRYYSCLVIKNFRIEIEHASLERGIIKIIEGKRNFLSLVKKFQFDFNQETNINIRFYRLSFNQRVTRKMAFQKPVLMTHIRVAITRNCAF